MRAIAVLAAFFGLFSVVYSQNSCITPNGEQAACVSIYQCKVFTDALNSRTPEVIRFMRESRCGYAKDPLVCCGSVAKYENLNIPDPVTQPTKTPGDILSHRNAVLLPRKGYCGIQVLQDKVFGGNITGIDEFPWMALLEYTRNGKSAGHSCGGVLINERYVLTAAHCIVGQIKVQVGDLYRVRLGEYNQQTAVDCVKYLDEGGNEISDCADPHVDYDVEEAIAHREYDENSKSKYHDIGIVRLTKKVQYSDFVKPICLPLNAEKTLPGQNMSVAGWGYTEKGIYSPIKLKANLPVVSNQQCGKVFAQRFNVQVANTQMCAGGVKNVDSCNGDSGGPLMNTFPGDTSFFAEGIVSFGSQYCGTEGLPGIYTRITEYMDWILDNMKPF